MESVTLLAESVALLSKAVSALAEFVRLVMGSAMKILGFVTLITDPETLLRESAHSLAAPVAPRAETPRGNAATVIARASVISWLVIAGQGLGK
ncbi:MAG: hypothetical protein QOH71_2300 [Blastocatellia bacterium]|nr:hypothetical protein [Blastocatellia bacterium]